jgi:hypothetical protein
VDFRFQTHLARGQYYIECDVHDRTTHDILARLNPAALLTISEMRTQSGVVALDVEAVGVEAQKRSKIAQAG